MYWYTWFWAVSSLVADEPPTSMPIMKFSDVAFDERYMPPLVRSLVLALGVDST